MPVPARRIPMNESYDFGECPSAEELIELNRLYDEEFSKLEIIQPQRA